jgi:hypothetical protein
VRVGATVWPSHSHVPLKQGDVVTLEGAYNKRTSTNEDGEERTFHNVSVTRLLVHGTADTGKREETTNDSSADDDDITF